MISEITGELRAVDEDRVHLACGNLVYEILIPASDLITLHATLGQQITFHTIFDLEGDATRGGLTPRLIGFLRRADKRFFQLFITVKGIGPKRALRALVQPTGQIAEAIESKNTRFLVQLPEIGKRTADQIVAELAGKMHPFATGLAVPGSPAASTRTTIEQTAVEGALALGIPRLDAERLLDRAKLAEPPLKSTEALLREMLRLRAVRT
ncbi:MAG: helix-hairpin-helix domain-containing protein [Planctomycetota bacterium]|nr:helix-hairpin-helix domain-containing protein [Planctomycetota bacterium]